MATLHVNTAENIKNGYAKVVPYEDIKGITPANLKISPVANKPQNSQKFRTILDQSFKLKHNGQFIDSINLETTNQAPEESMI